MNEYITGLPTATGIIKCTCPDKGWWAVVFDNDLSLLYRKWVNGDWDLPRSGPHISFIRGPHEDSPNSNIYKYEGSGVDVDFYPVITTNGESFWIDCKSHVLDTIRKDCGMSKYYRDYYHITLGNLKNKVGKHEDPSI